MKVTVNKCRYTGKLFEDDTKYRNHLAKLRREHKKAREYEALKNGFEDWLAKEKLEITSVDMLGDWILKNQRHLMDSYNAIHGDSWDGGVFHEQSKITDINFDFRRISDVGNGHNCPRGGVTNWYRKDELPLFYVGWPGQVIFNTHIVHARGKSHASVTQLLKMVDIHTGGGGGSSGNYSYSVNVFMSDWPAMEELYIVNKLKGTT